MPPPPEIRDAVRAVGIAEVLRKLDAEQQPEADGHVAVAGKIEIELQTVADRARPRAQRVEAFLRVDRVNKLGSSRGQQHLFCQPADEAAAAVKRAVPCDAPRVQQRLNLRKPHQRPGGQLRKKRQVLQRLPEAARTALRRAIDVYNVADGLKRIKRNAERQRAAPFIYGQHRKIDRHTRGQQQPAPAPGAHERKPHGVMQRAGGQQQRQMAQIAEGVEHESCRDQQRVFCLHGPQQVIRDQHERQKRKQKKRGSEIHKRFSCKNCRRRAAAEG